MRPPLVEVVASKIVRHVESSMQIANPRWLSALDENLVHDVFTRAFCRGEKTGLRVDAAERNGGRRKKGHWFAELGRAFHEIRPYRHSCDSAGQADASIVV